MNSDSSIFNESIFIITVTSSINPDCCILLIAKNRLPIDCVHNSVVSISSSTVPALKFIIACGAMNSE